MKMFLQLLRKEFLLIANTPLLFWMNTLYPIIVIGVLPFATTMEVDSLKTIIIDQDQSEISRELTEKFFQAGYFIPIKDLETSRPLSFEEAFKWVKRRKADVVITIPYGFEKAIYNEKEANISIVANSINATKGATAQAYSQYLIADYQRELVEKKVASSNPTNNIEFRQKTLFNPLQNYKYFVIPGMISILITLISITMPSISIVQEKEFGTIEQLNVTPINPTLILLSKALPYWLLIMLIMPILLLLIGLLYGLWSFGAILPIVVISILDAIAFTSIGFIIANYSSRMQQLMFMIIFFLINVLLLGGVFTPVAGMPIWARTLAKILPNYYYTRELRTLFLRGGGFNEVAEGLIILALYAIVLSLVARLSYNKRS